MRRRGLSGDLRPTQVPSAQVQCVRISHVPHRAGKIAAVRRKTKGLGVSSETLCACLDLHQSARASPMLLAGSTSSKCFWTLPRSLTSCKADALGIGALQLSFPKIISGRIRDAARQGLGWRQRCQTVGRLAVAARPSARSDADAFGCHNPRKRRARAASAPRRKS
jgi:hypothetical protein